MLPAPMQARRMLNRIRLIVLLLNHKLGISHSRIRCSRFFLHFAVTCKPSKNCLFATKSRPLPKM